VCVELLAASAHGAGDPAPFLDRHRVHPAVLHLGDEIAVGDVRRRRLFLLEHGHEQEDDDQDDDPEGHVLVELLIQTATSTVR
jgi:hypothetical protein